MKLTKVPVFPNWVPYNDMLLDRHLKVGPYEGVKTRSWKWNYRGPVLLYNSGRTAQEAVRTYAYDHTPSRHKVIIGAGELVEVRPLTRNEALEMVCNFNNLSHAKVREILRSEGFPFPLEDPEWSFAESPLSYFYEFGPFIAPFEIGFFFKKLARFQNAVPFNWPSGPIRPIYTKIVAGSRLHAELSKARF